MPDPRPPGSIDYDSLRHLLPPRRREAYKGDFGHVLVVGGDRGYGGAALMAAEAACRVGAGLVSVATHPAHLPAFLARRPELMVRGVEEGGDLQQLLERATVVVVGPGLGQSDWGRISLRTVLQSLRGKPLPLVADADALNLIAADLFPDLVQGLRDWILTPHPGEAARLLRCGTAQVQEDRAAAAQRLQAQYGGAVVLKGAGSLIAWSQGGRLHLECCGEGNPGMASGGMGDILSGVLGGLLAQGFGLAEAARLGVCLHACSADRAAAELGERGLLATDLLPWLQRLVNPQAN